MPTYQIPNRLMRGYKASGTGVVDFHIAGVPTHMRPETKATTEQDTDTVNKINSATMPIKSARVKLTGAATVLWEVANDPTDTTWTALSSVTTTSTITENNEYNFSRFRISAYTSGTVEIDLVITG